MQDLHTDDNLFDDKKKDTMAAVSDSDLEDLDPADKIGISLRARTGALLTFVLRIDGDKLTNVALAYKGLSGEILLPGKLFEFAISKSGEGKLKLTDYQFDGHKYSCDIQFLAKQYIKPIPTEEPPTPTFEPTPTLPQANTTTISNDRLTALYTGAIMQKDEDQAIKIIRLGLDPNSKDQYGVPLLNWAVMTCLPKVVQVLVNKNADLKYERAPGMTIMTEAEACPEAAKILKEAGAK